jgi:hypothetical protein
MEVSVHHHKAVGLPLVRTPVPIKQKAEFVPHPVWTFRRRKLSLATVRFRTPGGPARSLGAIPLMPAAVLNWFFGSGFGYRRVRRTGGITFDKGKQNICLGVTLFTKLLGD